MPVAHPEFNLSLYEGLLVASQLRQWIDHNLPVAEKYLLNSASFLHNRPSQLAINPAGLSVDNAMIAGPGPPFVMEPTGAALALMSRLAGAQRLGSTVVGGPSIIPAPGLRVPVLQTLAASSHGRLDILVINVSPTTSVRAKVQLGYPTAPSNMTVSVLDGPSTTSYNTFSRPRLVKVATRVTRVRGRNLSWTFPAHSLTLLQLGQDRDKPSSARGFRSRQWKLVLIPGRGGSLTPRTGAAEHPSTPLVPERPQGGNISSGWLRHPEAPSPPYDPHQRPIPPKPMKTLVAVGPVPANELP
jgi:hypothetical protein